jgi:hypothetical protein
MQRKPCEQWGRDEIKNTFKMDSGWCKDQLFLEKNNSKFGEYDEHENYV